MRKTAIATALMVAIASGVALASSISPNQLVTGLYMVAGSGAQSDTYGNSSIVEIGQVSSDGNGHLTGTLVGHLMYVVSGKFKGAACYNWVSGSYQMSSNGTGTATITLNPDMTRSDSRCTARTGNYVVAIGSKASSSNRTTVTLRNVDATFSDAIGFDPVFDSQN